MTPIEQLRKLGWATLGHAADEPRLALVRHALQLPPNAPARVAAIAAASRAFARRAARLQAQTASARGPIADAAKAEAQRCFAMALAIEAIDRHARKIAPNGKAPARKWRPWPFSKSADVHT